MALDGKTPRVITTREALQYENTDLGGAAARASWRPKRLRKLTVCLRAHRALDPFYPQTIELGGRMQERARRPRARIPAAIAAKLARSASRCRSRGLISPSATRHRRGGRSLRPLEVRGLRCAGTPLKCSANEFLGRAFHRAAVSRRRLGRKNGTPSCLRSGHR